ncbi:hypothetical protein GCM10010129_67800 [Streptomyces fumigatiscleroticus]|nr:hypothetical protein GCM10010129_67800 [Streptomyces fumigatiscleroticus]
MGSGRHGRGDNVFVYLQDPHDNVVEYTCELQQIPDGCAWQPRNRDWLDADQWGIAGPSDALVALREQACPDSGLWTPAPV